MNQCLEDILRVRIAGSMRDIDAERWEACANPPGEPYNPFVSHAFLDALERSGSATARTGWLPQHLLLEDSGGGLLAAAPCYLKSHSRGEFVFDWGWADAYERAGGRYYPKLQIAVPFSPVPGPRVLTQQPELAPLLIAAAESVVRDNGLSSAHATFIAEEQVPLFEQAGWLIRTDSQFHWLNRGYRSFDDFLAELSSRKRKAIRKERASAVEGLTIQHFTGDAIEERHWDAFWHFYQDTGSRKWGRPYLTRSFFSLLGERLGDRVLLILALRAGRPIAGALHVVGADALCGRYWGALEEVPFLHFELCYYQAIEWAISRGLARVEAGAQGAHKLARGYRPVPTWSAHYVADAGFREAVARFLAAERRAVAREIEALDEMAPFRRG